MREILKPTLTNMPQPSYAKGGDVVMEGKPDMPPAKSDSQPASLEHAEGSVSAEQKAAAGQAWGKANEKRAVPVEERRTQKMLAEKGIFPMAGAAQDPGEPEKPEVPPPPPPEEQPQRTDEGKEPPESNQEGNYVDEKEIQSDTLRAYVKELNEFIKRVTATRNTRGWAELRKRLGEIEPPKGFTREQRQAFDLDKAKLLGAMAEAIQTISPQRAELEQKYSELEIAIRAEDYDAVDKVINSIDIDDYNMYATTIREAVDKIGGYDHMLEYLLEYGVERILNIADVNPKVQYPSFNLYQTQNLDSVTQAARFYDERRGDKSNRVFKYLTDLRNKRYAMHELARSMKSRENYVKLVTELLRQDGLAFVEKEIAGVSDVQIAYEKVLGSRLSLKNGWLMNDDYDQADDEVKRSLDESVSLDMEVLKKNFKRDRKDETRALRPWEVRRAWLVGKSLHSATQRRLIYALLGDVPKEDTDIYLKSVESEFIARILGPMKLFPERFFGWPIAERFMKFYIEHQKETQRRRNRSYGYLKNGEEKGLYGKKASVFPILDTGVTDPKSNSWRGRLLFLRQNDFRTETMPDGNKESIGEYLRLTKIAIGEKIKDRIRREIAAKHPRKSEADLDKMINTPMYKRQIRDALGAEYNEEIRSVISNQRLFLGVLLHNFADLDESNRTQIWENASKFLPSRIAAFFPDELKETVGRRYNLTSDKEIVDKWNQIKSKLFLAEMMRVRDDAKSLRENGKGSAEISNYFDQLKMDFMERDIIGEIQSFGKGKAGDLAKIKFPFTPFLDDAPKTDWENLADEDFDRILINDQSAFAEGYSKVIGLIAKQETKPEEVIKAFTEAFAQIAGPMGQPDARAKLEPAILAYLDMARMNNLAKFMNSVMGLLRMPRSEMEKNNLQARIAHDVREQRDILRGLAQAGPISDDPESISDDPEEGSGEKIINGQTQLLRMEKRSKADLKALLLSYFRILTLIFGIEFAKTFMKAISPEDLTK